MGKFRILSFDGGGIKGVCTVSLLQRLNDEWPGYLEKVDLFAGTSTGGLIALCLAAGMPLDSIKNLYVCDGKEIFKRSWAHWCGLTGSKYTNKGLRKVVGKTFGDLRLGDLKRKVMIPSFDLKSSNPPHDWKPKFFHNFGDDRDDPVLVSDVAMYTTAAPTYFPAVDGYIDGGVIANNPSMAAICQAMDERYGDEAKVDDVVLLSIGTGATHNHINRSDFNFGAFDVSRIVNILLSGTESVPDYQCHVILGDNYLRIDPEDGKNTRMDDVSEIPHLIRIAEEYDIRNAVAWLDDHWI
jgi:patatin-like phospholipase/acyl hydrolase